MTSVQDIFKKCSPWMRLSICVNIHIKNALINVLHNHINNPQVQPLPSDPADLYAFLQTNKRKIQKSTFIKENEKSILLPINCQSVDSSSFGISLIRFLIQTFSRIRNAKGDWKEPDSSDQTLCAYVFRAARLRNRICHNNDVDKLDDATFENLWKELKTVLQGLQYAEDIKAFKTETLEYEKLKSVILEEFVGHLQNYKKECLNEPVQDDYIQRRFFDNRNRNKIIIRQQCDENDIIEESHLDDIFKENDCVIIYGEAGMGKSSTARRVKNEWCNDNMLKDLNVLYFDSKKINKQLKVQSNAAPLYFSELGSYLRTIGITEDDLSIYHCVKTTIEKLIILVDGIDEFPIKDFVTTENYFDELEAKVKNNEEITAADTVNAIHFGFLFPNVKICLLGRYGEIDQLRNAEVDARLSIFNEANRKVKDLKLLKFDDKNVKDFTCNKICKQPNQQCIRACQEMYEEIKNIELCYIPMDLNSLIELRKKHPNKNIGRITRTKLLIAALYNRLMEHVNQKNIIKPKTFRQLSKQKDKNKFAECIRALSEISFDVLSSNKDVTIEVEEEQGINGIDYFKYKDQMVEREILVKLDLFYIRDLDFRCTLEPHHTLNMEFLSACHLLAHPKGWKSILELWKDRQLAIIPLIAGLHADDYFTKDFVTYFLKVSSIYSIEQFFSWLYNVENVRESLPDGGDYSGYNSWYGLMENQKLSPSFFFLNSISQEIEISQIFLPKTIVCYCDNHSFEWYNMDFFRHNFLTKLSDKSNIESFLTTFQSFNFVIKGGIKIRNDYEFNLFNQCGKNNLIKFEINQLIINTSLNACFSFNFNLNTLVIWEECDSRTIDMILDVLSSSPTNTFISNNPTIKSKRLHIYDIRQLNSQQTEKLFKLGLSNVVDFIAFYSNFFTNEQIDILKNMELKFTKKLVNIGLYGVEFNRLFGLPNLGSRHILLYHAKSVTDNDVINLKTQIQLGYSNKISNYKLIYPLVPFVPKDNCSHNRGESMYLNLFKVDFTQVSPKVFAETFSSIPSLACEDDEYDIPSSHWFDLSQVKNCQIKEMKIWFPKSKNFKHFLHIRINTVQYIFRSKFDLKQFLNHIVNNPDVESDKEIKVFVVKYDHYDWNHYKEISVFGNKTIKEYKNNPHWDDLLLDNICVSSNESEQHHFKKKWCCEISPPTEKNDNMMIEPNHDMMICFLFFLLMAFLLFFYPELFGFLLGLLITFTLIGAVLIFLEYIGIVRS